MRKRRRESVDSAKAREVPARIGGLGVYATPVQLRAHQRTRGERLTLTVVTLLGCWTIAPLAFLIPPHFESTVVAFALSLYFGRRAWVGEWQIDTMAGTCPRCGAAITLKHGSMLYLPHTLHCGGCRGELWLELEPAPVVDAALRESARLKVLEESRPAQELGGRPPLTWSPAASDWRDRRRS
jgi:hypothetical protein